MNLSDLTQCEICFGPIVERVRYVKVSNESWTNQSCSHSGKFCKGCLQQYVQSKLTDGCWNIRCPSVGCAYLMVAADLQRILASQNSTKEIDVFGQPISEAFALSVQDCTALLEKYRLLRNADHGAYLRAVLRMREAVTHASEESMAALATPALMDSETPKRPGNTDSQRETGEPHEVASSEADHVIHASNETESGLAEIGFGAWALDSCQACPRCLVIIRKEVGCNHIQCRCGTSFCYGCGAPFGSDHSNRECLCRRGTCGSDKFCLWLQQTGSLDTVA